MLHLRDGNVGGLAILIAVDVLHGALIGLDAAELQVRRSNDRLGDRHYLIGLLHAAAAGATVDLDKAFERRAVGLRRSRQVSDVGKVVDADDDARAEFRHAGKPIDLRGVAHLVRDEDVLDAGTGKDLCFGDLLAA